MSVIEKRPVPAVARRCRLSSGLLLIVTSLLLSGCNGADKGGKRPPPLVGVDTVELATFDDDLQAVGEARAREQVTLAAPVTERVVSVHFPDGGFVRAGQIIAVLAQSQENASLAAAGARAREAQQQLSRLQELKQRGFATNSSVDAQYAAATAARAEAAQASAQIGDRIIRAPFSGWASLRTISAGTIVVAGTEIATISDISQIKLDFPVPEGQLDKLAADQPISATAAAYPDAPFEGHIATIDPVIDPATRSVMVRALLANPDRRIKPGMLMTVKVRTGQSTSLAVPESAVVGDGERRYVYVVEEENMLKRVEIKPGQRVRGKVQVLSGLTKGQRVVSHGVVKASDGIKVSIEGEKSSGPATGSK